MEILAFLASWTIQILTAIIAGLLLILFRRTVLSTIIGAYLWLTNKEVEITKIQVYLSINSIDMTGVKRLVNTLKDGSHGFEVFRIDAPNCRYILSSHGYSIKLTAYDQLVDSPDTHTDGVKLKAEIDNLLVPYRSGLTALKDTMYNLIRGIDQTFGKEGSKLSVKFVLPPPNPNKPEVIIFANSSTRSRTTISRDAMTLSEKDIDTAMKSLKQCVSRYRASKPPA